jgi:glutaredoxin
MNKKIIIPTILFILVLIVSFFLLLENKENSQLKNEPSNNQENQQKEQSQIILFYGDGCPHCAIVEEYIKENNINDKISFAQKEVYYNQNNAKELEVKAKICGLETDSIGVPFLWDGEKCLIGDQDIINFFKQKTNEQ